MTTAEVAELLRTSANELQQARHEQRETPPWLKIGRRVLYRRTDVEQWLADRVHHPRAAAS